MEKEIANFKKFIRYGISCYYHENLIGRSLLINLENYLKNPTSVSNLDLYFPKKDPNYNLYLREETGFSSPIAHHVKINNYEDTIGVVFKMNEESTSGYNHEISLSYREFFREYFNEYFRDLRNDERLLLYLPDEKYLGGLYISLTSPLSQLGIDTIFRKFNKIDIPFSSTDPNDLVLITIFFSPLLKMKDNLKPEMKLVFDRYIKIESDKENKALLISSLDRVLKHADSTLSVQRLVEIEDSIRLS